MNKRLELELSKIVNNEEIVNIRLSSSNGIKLDSYNIVIDNKNYNINSQHLFSDIYEIIKLNINGLVDNAQRNNIITDRNNLIKINIKLGQLEINIETSSSNENNFYNDYVNAIVEEIKENGEKNDSDYFMKFINQNNETLEDEELMKYFRMYEERFGKKAYIAEVGGTREKTIEAIKKCLEEDKDMLDDILYPDKKDDVLY